MSWLVWPIVAMLGASALIEVWCIAKRRTVLDRTLAADALVATLVCALGVEAVVRDHSTTLPVVVTLSMVGFVATVAVSRFVAGGRETRAQDGSARDVSSRDGATLDTEGPSPGERGR